MRESSKLCNKQEIPKNLNKFKIVNRKKTTDDLILNRNSSVIIFDTYEFTYSELKKYEYKEIISIIHDYNKENSMLIQINNDEPLQEYILKTITKKLDHKDKMKSNKKLELDLDYLVEIDSSLLCLNMSVISDPAFQDIEKYMLQLYCFEKGMIIFNKSGNEEILKALKKEYHFKERKNNSITDKIFRSADSLKKLEVIKIPENLQGNNNLSRGFTPRSLFSNSDSNSDFINLHKKEFSIDCLLYCLINITLEKLKTLVSDVYRESKSIKKIYLEISENERKDFYRRIECIDIFTVLIRNETLSKRRFIEFVSKNYFSDSASDKKYFYKKSVFLMELLLAKSKQIEIQFNKINFISKMVKENYKIILDDNSKKNKDRLNQITQIISLMSVLFMPFTFISSIFGMNIKLPFVEWDSLIPFFIVIAIMIIVFCVHIIVFKRYNFI